MAFLGDVLLSIPPVFEVLGNEPLVWVVRSGLRDLVKLFFPAAFVFEVKKKDGATYSALKKQLRKILWKEVYLPHTSWRSLMWVKSLSAQAVWTYATVQSSLFPFLKRERPRHWPEPLRIYQLFSHHPHFRLNLDDSEILALSRPSQQGLLPEVSNLFPRFAESLQNSNLPRRQRIVFFPGSRWGTKQWPLKHWLDLDRRMTQMGLEVYWLGSKEEGSEWSPHISKEKNLAGTMDWQHTWQFLRETRWVIAGDTGGGHLAALAGCHLLSLWGPTHLSFGYRPWGDRVWILEKKDLPCRPCHHHGPEHCPLKHHRCMHEIHVDEVIAWFKGTF